mmetsp:Transcript_11329/g.34154  ORF Transcript_11329/g.34154 Transcript_11329/m.34154 type:complete len:83 (+) Transcript_11329:2922-3170(+)
MGRDHGRRARFYTEFVSFYTYTAHARPIRSRSSGQVHKKLKKKAHRTIAVIPNHDSKVEAAHCHAVRSIRAAPDIGIVVLNL